MDRTLPLITSSALFPLLATAMDLAVTLLLATLTLVASLVELASLLSLPSSPLDSDHPHTLRPTCLLPKTETSSSFRLDRPSPLASSPTILTSPLDLESSCTLLESQTSLLLLLRELAIALMDALSSETTATLSSFRSPLLPLSVPMELNPPSASE